MAGADVIVNNARSMLRNTPKGKLYLYLFVIVAVIGGSLIFFSFMQKETYHTLFSGLSTEDASMIVTKLKELKVPYKLGMDGTAIHVPKERAYEIRLMLASNNALPGSGGVGFELFDKTNYGMTEFMQNVNYKRAIQGELSRTINQMPEVKGSRVHIALPEKSLFTDREKEVVQLMAEGNSTKQIALKLHISGKTVETHRRQIMSKLDIHNVAELTKYAIRKGITSVDG